MCISNIVCIHIVIIASAVTFVNKRTKEISHCQINLERKVINTKYISFISLDIIIINNGATSIHYRVYSLQISAKISINIAGIIIKKICPRTIANLIGFAEKVKHSRAWRKCERDSRQTSRRSARSRCIDRASFLRGMENRRPPVRLVAGRRGCRGGQDGEGKRKEGRPIR